MQRRSANRLSGWLGYTLTSARERQYAISVPGFPIPLFANTPYTSTLEDQRNALNVFGTYRLKPTVNLSGKFLYGSGFPVPSGFFEQIGGNVVPFGVSAAHPIPYLRLDFRVDKCWAFQRWKMTLYGEGLNLTNHDNPRSISLGVVDPKTGRAIVQSEQGLPITPTAGLVFEF